MPSRERLYPFGWFEPDKGEYGPHLVELRNALPSHHGYIPAANLVTVGSALGSDPPLGHFSSIGSDESTFALTGTKDQLSSFDGSQFTSLGLTIGTDISGQWFFENLAGATYGCNGVTRLVKYDQSGGTASILSGGPNQARYLANIRDFLVVGHTSDSPFRVQWSGWNTPEDWTIAQGRGGYLDLDESFGQIVGLTGGDRGIVIQAEGIVEVRDIGADGLGFGNRIVGLGSEAPNSIITHGNRIAFLSRQGFVETDGRNVEYIGAGKVDNWFRDQAANLTNVLGVYDAEYKRLLWSFKGGEGTTAYDHILIYQLDLQAWGLVQIDHSWLTTGLNPGKTLEQLDTLIPDINQSTLSVDSDTLKGGTRTLGVFSSDHKYGSFSGASLPVHMRSAYAPIEQHRDTLITGVQPIVRWTTTPNNLATAMQVGLTASAAPRGTDDYKPLILGMDHVFHGQLFGQSFALEIDLNESYEQCDRYLLQFVPGGRR